MKYLKTFEFFSTETGQALDYEVGDNVICFDDEIANLKSTKPNPLINGDKYKVLRIYNNLEDKYLNIKYKRVDVENLETGEISRGWESTRFKTESETIADKYNI
jgi:hypothetical protein